ncbi:D-alanyl-D-alanine carboxypeptidase/D-alanyl-D-alanine endopeptidase [Dyella silvatica]|uniref:D-alanyl-D-alanine carboxypeptidase/D-alanyl-D-alanine endopeptidase n=1 Tax=Dyella silvatica TaxID=2992128 RepID=UPI0022579052|nr:D-alanyl-D-alanine carboxypeptidase/D-alanyl-D-alanine-endopeptidase [Dyella silvatica]
MDGLTGIGNTCRMKSLSLNRLRSIAYTCVMLTAVLALPIDSAARSAAKAPANKINASLPLAAQIDEQINQPRFATASWGIAVVSLDTGRTLYTHQADQLFQLASTAKLFTAALTLSELSADSRVSTRLLAGDGLHNGQLQGPLILYGMGDPTLGADTATLNWADQLATQLAERGVRLVHGDLIADDTFFASPPMGSGWEAIDLQSWFAVPTSALSVQDNQVDVTVSPGRAEGESAVLAFDPPDALPTVINQLTTSAPHSRNDINLYRAPGADTLNAFGNIAVRTPAQGFKLAVPDPALLAGMQLLQALARHGIHVDGKVQTRHWPQSSASLREGTSTVAEVQSPTVGQILQLGLKHSQNLYMQNLLLLAGTKAQADAMQDPAPPTGFVTTEAWGIRALRQLLDRIGIPASASMIEEGTGLSRRNLATPNAMTRLLGFLASQPYAATLHDMLPIAGIDGTLQWRLRNTPASNNVHAKTGSMSQVHALAGYVTSAAGEHLAFAIMLNNYEPPAGAPSASRDLDVIAVLLANLRTHN